MMKENNWSGPQKLRMSKDLSKMYSSRFRWVCYIILVVSTWHLKSGLLSTCYPMFIFASVLKSIAWSDTIKNKVSLFFFFPKSVGVCTKDSSTMVCASCNPLQISVSVVALEHFPNTAHCSVVPGSKQSPGRRRALGGMFTLPALIVGLLAGAPQVPSPCHHLMWPGQASGGNSHPSTWFPGTHPLSGSKCRLIVSCLILKIWPQQQVSVHHCTNIWLFTGLADCLYH